MIKKKSFWYSIGFFCLYFCFLIWPGNSMAGPAQKNNWKCGYLEREGLLYLQEAGNVSGQFKGSLDKAVEYTKYRVSGRLVPAKAGAFSSFWQDSTLEVFAAGETGNRFLYSASFPIWGGIAGAEPGYTLEAILYQYRVELLVIGLVVFLFMGAGLISILRMNGKLHMQNEKYAKLSEISEEFIYEYDMAEDKLMLSPTLRKLLEEQLPTVHFKKRLKHEFAKLRGAEYHRAVLIFQSMLDTQRTKEEITLLLPEKGERAYRVVHSAIQGQKGGKGYIIGKFLDITDEVEEKRLLKKRAEMDILTGVYNSGTIRSKVTQALLGVRKGEIDALLIIDVDHFKEVNDTLGHYMGDIALQGVARDIRHVFREDDLVGRLGGDEFCVYIHGVPSVDVIKSRCEQLRKTARRTIINEGKQKTVTLSMGILLVKEPLDFETAYQYADQTLYQSKKDGRNCFHILERIDVG